MEFEVEEYTVTTLLDGAHNLWALGIEEFHTNLHKRLTTGELIQEVERLLLAAEIASNNYITFAHYSSIFLFVILRCQ